MSNPWIQTRDGHIVDLVKPDLSALSLDEIAHSLAGLARFTGHTSPYYSVAQHSVMVSFNVPPQYALDGLLHDVHECIMGDISSPVKAAIRFFGGGDALKKLERGLREAVHVRWGVAADLPPSVHLADMRALVTERRDLLGDFEAQPWEVDFEPFDEKISEVWTRSKSRQMFVDCFNALWSRR